MKCPHCGAEIDENARFCIFCMTSLTEKKIIIHRKKPKRNITVAAVLICLFAAVAVTAILSANRDKSDTASVTFLPDTTAVPTVSPTMQAKVTAQSAEPYYTPKSTQTGKYVEASSWLTVEGVSAQEYESAIYYYRDSMSLDDCRYDDAVVENGITILGVGASPNGEYIVPETLDGKNVVAIGRWAFQDENVAKNLTKVILPKTVKTVNGYAFIKCEHLSDLYISGSEIGIGEPNFSATPSLTIHCSSTCADRRNSNQTIKEYCDSKENIQFEEW